MRSTHKSHTETVLKNAVEEVLKRKTIKEFPKEEDPFIDVLDLRVDKEGILFYKMIGEKAVKYGTYMITDEDSELICNLDEAYEMLEDDNSKKIYDWYFSLMVARILTKSLKEAEQIFNYSFLDGNMKSCIKKFIKQASKCGDDLYKINDYVIRTSAPALMETWTCDNYMLDGICEVKPEDIVIDAGAYKGETAIWFANKMHKSGKVYAFELIKEHANTIKENALRNNIQHIINVENTALWSEKTYLGIKKNDSISECTVLQNQEGILTQTIDTFVDERNIRRIDFLKADVESAEIEMLKGAQKTIERDKPKLAICIYHRLPHMYEIPKLIRSYSNDYRFYLSHKTYGPMNTVLMAIPK